MTQTTMTRQAIESPVLDRKVSEEGPILLASKPFDATYAPLTVARWLARREERELRVVSVMEEQDGPVVPAIVDRAQEIDARVIIVGTGRHDPFGRIIYGERAMQVVRSADRPVLVVPREVRRTSFMNVVIAVDFGPASLRAARAVLPMLPEGARITLVHVRPDEPLLPDRHGFEIRCDELFARFANQLHVLPGLTVETRVLWGDSATVIQEYAQRNHVDLIACGRRKSHSLVERFGLGSVSAELLRTVTCPILIAPEQPDAAAEALRSVLTGVETWKRERWAEHLRELTLVCAGRTVRLGVEADVLHGGRSISQDYVLRTISFDEREQHLSILLADAKNPANLLSVKFTDICGITAFKDAGGALTRLVCDRDTGLVTLAMTADA